MTVENTEPPSDKRIATFAEFYPYYLTEHSDPKCRRLHYVGTFLSFIVLGLAIFSNPWWLLAGPVVGYGFAWYAHFFIEKNRPATFTYPLWSLISDYVMFFSWITGRIDGQLAKAGVTQA